MLNLIINYATLIAFLAFSADLLYQILKLYKTKSSIGVSVFGLIARTLGTIILLIKFISIEDMFLILGQLVFTILVIWYLLLAAKYKRA